MASDLNEDPNDTRSGNSAIIEMEEHKETPNPNKKISLKSRDKKKRREVIISAVDRGTETLVITQKVEVKKQKTKRVINWNTSICENIPLDLEQCKKRENTYKRYLKRTHPRCHRVKCDVGTHNRIGQKIRFINNKSDRKKSSHRSIENRSSSTSYSSKRSKRTKTKKKAKPVDIINIDEEHSLSSISLSPLEGDSNKLQISYDDISSDSFTSVSDENKIDVLIKRTKEREKNKNLSLSSLSENPFTANSPHSVIEISSEEESQVDFKENASLHSQETVLLKPKEEDVAYSPTASLDHEACDFDCHHNYETKLETTNNVNIISPQTDIKIELNSDEKIAIKHIQTDHNMQNLNYMFTFTNNNNNECHDKNEYIVNSAKYPE